MSYAPGQIRSIQTVAFTFSGAGGATQTFALGTAVLSAAKCVVKRFYRADGVGGFNYDGDHTVKVSSTTEFQCTGTTGTGINFEVQIVEYTGVPL